MPSGDVVGASTALCRAREVSAPAPSYLFVPLTSNHTGTCNAGTFTDLEALAVAADPAKQLVFPTLVPGSLAVAASALVCPGLVTGRPSGKLDAKQSKLDVEFRLYFTEVHHAVPTTHMMMRERYRGFYYCFISVSDAPISALRRDAPPRRRAPGARPVIAIGAPTVGHTGGASAIATTLLPSLLASINRSDASAFTYALYIGYDLGDALWGGGDPVGRARAESVIALTLAQRPHIHMTVRFVPLPYSHAWMSLVWGMLYAAADADGADYFFQVNDDLLLQTPGWPSTAVAALAARQGRGVGGPFDKSQLGLILTQALVDVRVHSAAFAGRLYPIELKDWYTDTWLTEVWSPWGGAEPTRGFYAKNLNRGGTRYAACTMPRYEEALERGRHRLRAWLDAHPSQ